MIAEGMVKQRFVDKILKEEAEIIKKLQLDIVNDWEIVDTIGQTEWDILKGHFSVKESGSGTTLTMRYIKYVRFIEMNNRFNHLGKGFHLYNKVVFGRVYNDTHMRLQYAYSEGIRQELIDEIRKSMQELNSNQ